MTILNHPHHARGPLDDVLLSLRLLDSRLCQSILSAPWGVEVPKEPHVAAFVAVARGPCRLESGGQRFALSEGDFLLLPHGAAHRLSDALGTPPAAAGALRWDSVLGRCVLNAGGDGETTHLITGCLSFAASPLTMALPPALPLPRGDELGWQEGVAGVLRREALRPGPGSEVVLSQLVGLLAVAAIRRWLRDGGVEEGFLRALRAPALRRALDALHADPSVSWTLDDLAQVAGMSRSAFSQQFTETMGESPIRYWTRWRMAVARGWLLDRETSVEEAADALGYRSRAAFSRAYKAHTGEPPGQTRRDGRRALRTLNDRLMEGGSSGAPGAVGQAR